MADEGGASDGFYVGYADAMPPELRRFVRRTVLAALAASAAVGALAVAFHEPFASSVFEYGHEREFVGWIRETPLPLLVVPGPPCTKTCAATSSWPLARYGTKRGAVELVRGLEGRQVRLYGVLVHRADQTLLDVVPGSIEILSGADRARAAGATPPPRVEDLGMQRVTGEIVDGKCHFGVMRPGDGKAHRSCAARCISSGAPPVLWVRDERGRERHLLLLGADGRMLNREILPFVAERVEIRGRVLRYDELLVLQAEPSVYRRR
ncbi:MAG TPA: hypothetical protein VLC53_13075 [Myxococcota bacterium]|nr:hypothetical protein [Myxococcota bacterium]